MKLLIISANVIILLFSITLGGACQSTTNQIQCIVIDAGHGGKDSGATSGTIREKDITLALAKKLGKAIREKHPGIKVILTRETDTFLELATRSSIANKANADLFISIHTNASKSSQANGSETFVMGVDKSSSNLAVSMRENDVVVLEADYTTKYEGYEPGSAESLIIFSLMQYSYLTQSLHLASLVQTEYTSRVKFRDRGVKQAGFFVLYQTAMPSILTEVGFISNPEERQRMTSEAGQKAITESLLAAVTKYINTQHTQQQNQPTRKLDPEPAVTTPVEKPRNEVFFRVLVCSEKDRQQINSMNFGQFVTIIEEQKIGKTYNYYSKKLFSYKETLLLQKKIRAIYPEASIVSYRGEEPISLEKAKTTNP